jgi:hypothetical protein
MLPKFKKNLLPLSLAISATLLTGCGSDDKNTAPELTGDLMPVVAENTLAVGKYTATDVNNDNITLSLNDAANALFTLEQSGALSFKIAPDFDNGDTGPFNVTITATDDGKGALSTSLAISITVGDVKDTPSLAVVQTIAPDYSNSEVAYLDAKSQQVASGYYRKDASDYTLSSYKGDVFHIGRFFIDQVTKYNASEETRRDTAIWSYSTNDPQDSTRNPYALVSLSDTKAYLLRYGSSKVWIVNPQATNSEDFKIGELDLSSYVHADNSSSTPSPAAAVINDGKLYIAMQRQDDSYNAGTAYVAVFDTVTDTEIETNANADDNVKGIPLVGVNPLEHSLVTNEDKVFVTTRNGYSSFDLSLSRIEEINTGDYTLRQVLNASNIEDNTASFIKASVVVSPEKGYFYASQAIFTPSYHEVSSLYEFNPTTGLIVSVDIAETGTENISFIGLDDANFLWVSIANPSLPGVDVIDTTTNTKRISRLATQLNPSTIRFIEE